MAGMIIGFLAEDILYRCCVTALGVPPGSCAGGGEGEGGGLGCIMLTVGEDVYVRRRMARKGREHIY